eukprot:scaffold1130_cov195-Pinguiococcus_pyrenoidosus.AAC.104
MPSSAIIFGQHPSAPPESRSPPRPLLKTSKGTYHLLHDASQQTAPLEDSFPLAHGSKDGGGVPGGGVTGSGVGGVAGAGVGGSVVAGAGVGGSVVDGAGVGGSVVDGEGVGGGVAGSGVGGGVAGSGVGGGVVDGEGVGGGVAGGSLFGGSETGWGVGCGVGCIVGSANGAAYGAGLGFELGSALGKELGPRPGARVGAGVGSLNTRPAMDVTPLFVKQPGPFHSTPMYATPSNGHSTRKFDKEVVEGRDEVVRACIPVQGDGHWQVADVVQGHPSIEEIAFRLRDAGEDGIPEADAANLPPPEVVDVRASLDHLTVGAHAGAELGAAGRSTSVHGVHAVLGAGVGASALTTPGPHVVHGEEAGIDRGDALRPGQLLVGCERNEGVEVRIPGIAPNTAGHADLAVQLAELDVEIEVAAAGDAVDAGGRGVVLREAEAAQREGRTVVVEVVRAAPVAISAGDLHPRRTAAAAVVGAVPGGGDEVGSDEGGATHEVALVGILDEELAHALVHVEPWLGHHGDVVAGIPRVVLEGGAALEAPIKVEGLGYFRDGCVVDSLREALLVTVEFLDLFDAGGPALGAGSVREAVGRFRDAGRLAEGCCRAVQVANGLGAGLVGRVAEREVLEGVTAQDAEGEEAKAEHRGAVVGGFGF